MARPCSQCGLPVQWIRDGVKPDGNPRWKCYNADRTEHWDTCSRERTRKALAGGVPFKDSKGEGVIYQGKKKYMHMMAETHYGRPVRMKKSRTA